MSRYKIKILSLQGVTLYYTISEYKIIEGDFITFLDEKTGRKKTFHASRCELEEINEWKFMMKPPLYLMPYIVR